MLSLVSRQARGATVRALAPAGSRLLATKAELSELAGALSGAKADLKSLSPAMKELLGSVEMWEVTAAIGVPKKPPVTVAVSGASTPAAQKALFHIAAGEMLGAETPVVLKVSGAPASVLSELTGYGFPLLKGATAADGASLVGDASYAMLLDGDFAALGSALKADAKVGVMGETNALIVASKAPKATVTSISSVKQVAAEAALMEASLGKPIPAKPVRGLVKKMIVWGNGVVDHKHATYKGKWAYTTAPELSVGEPSTAAAADALCAHMKALALGTDGEWISMGMPAVGDFNMGTGFFFSVPVVTTPGSVKRVGGISLDPAVAEAMEAARQTLLAEKKKAGL